MDPSAPAECDKLPPHPLKKVLRIAEERDLQKNEQIEELHLEIDAVRTAFLRRIRVLESAESSTED